jgi:hypothetical protein
VNEAVKLISLHATQLLPVAWLLLNFAPAATPHAASLVTNGDFQADSKAVGWPDGWGSKGETNGKTWESEEGRHFMRLVSQQPGQLQVLYREIKLKPGQIKGITVTIRYRTEGVKADGKPSDNARAVLLFSNKAGSLLDPPPAPMEFLAHSTGWREVTKEIPIPETAARMTLMMGLFDASAGTVDIADVTCTPLDDAPAASLVPTLPTAAPAPLSWITNDEFAIPDTTGNWPQDWGKPALGMSWPQEDGKHFVRIVSQTPGVSLMMKRDLPLPGGVHGIELLIRFRATGIEHGDHEWFDARTIVHFLDANGQQVANEGKNLDVVFTHKPASTGWVDLSHFLTVPESATKLELSSGLFQVKAGTVDLAEIRVIPLSEADTDLLQTAGAAYISWKGDINAEMDNKAEAQIEAQLAATHNLVPNGSFELATKNPAWPDGWGNGPLPSLNWEKENGKRFMRLTAQNPPSVVMLYKMVLLNSGLKGVDLSLRYRLSGFVKGDTPPGDARMQLHFLNGTRVGHLENGKDLTPDLADIVFLPTAGAWKVVHSRFLVDPGSTKLQLMPALWNSKAGTLDLSDLRVAPLNEAEVAALSANTPSISSKTAAPIAKAPAPGSAAAP